MHNKQKILYSSTIREKFWIVNVYKIFRLLCILKYGHFQAPLLSFGYYPILKLFWVLRNILLRSTSSDDLLGMNFRVMTYTVYSFNQFVIMKIFRVWAYFASLGWSLSFPSIFSKTWQMHQIWYASKETRFTVRRSERIFLSGDEINARFGRLDYRAGPLLYS